MTTLPILFSGPMVRAILDGRKTVTRRLVKERHASKELHAKALDIGVSSAVDTMPDHLRYPYGRHGDSLWVKEAWKPTISHPCVMDNVRYREPVFPGHPYREADTVLFDPSSIPEEWTIPKAANGKGWVSPLIMPRWAARIFLKVTEVTVERVQAITEEDAQREGVASREEFACLWDSLAKPGTLWADNPWVWRIGFGVEEVKR